MHVGGDGAEKQARRVIHCGGIGTVEGGSVESFKGTSSQRRLETTHTSDAADVQVR